MYKRAYGGFIMYGHYCNTGCNLQTVLELQFFQVDQGHLGFRQVHPDQPLL